MTMKMTMAEFVGLEPCPFCGGEARIFHFSSAIRDEVWRAVCDKPFCAQGPDGYTEAEAIEAWNTRAERTCHNIDDEFPFFKCSECGCNAVIGYGSSGDGLPSYCPHCGAKVVEK